MALKEYIGLTRLTEVFGYLKTKLDGKVDKNGTDRLITSSEATKLDNINKVTVIDSSTDLNDCTDINLLYSISGSAVPVHAPTNYSYNAAIWNKTYGDYAVQFYWTNDGAKLYYRRNNNGSWGGWRTIAVTSDIPTDAGDLNYDNTTSGLSATDVQAAIDEIAQGGGSTYTEGDGIDISQQNEISIDTTFTEASTRANIASGDTFSTILGKIKKWFTDLPNMFVSKQNGGTFEGDVTVDRKDGTASAEGFSYFKVGNSTPAGTNQNSTGLIDLYSESEYSARLYANPLTQQRYIGLPDKNGTVALTSDIPSLDDVKSVKNYYDSRPASANVQFGDGRLRHFKASSSMTTGKPVNDGHIIHLAWDNNGGYDGQIALINSDGGMQFRTQSGGTWSAWRTVINSGNIGSQSVNYANSAGSATNASNATRLYAHTDGGTGYVSGDTHILRLGYFERDAGYNNVTLLVTSAFWGNQHGSADIINMNQDSNGGNTQDLWRVKISDKATRTFYYKVANDVVYLYVYVTGGNGYGKWNVSVMQASNNKAQWIDEVAYNQSSSGLTEIPYSGRVGYANSAGSAGNVTGTVAIANGGTGANMRTQACANLFSENVGSSATFFMTCTNNYAKAGYSSLADIKTALGLKSAAYLTAATAATANTVAQRDGSGHLTMVDCKCAAVVVTSNNWLPICGYGAVTIRNRDNSAYIPAFASAFTVNSSRRYKENIVSMTEEDAKALLSLRPVTFDYKEGVIDGDRTGQKGLIAEEVAEIETFPVVYNQEGEVEGLDYSKFVPQLIKLCQMQQNEIDELKVRLDILERAIVTMTQS